MFKLNACASKWIRMFCIAVVIGSISVLSLYGYLVYKNHTRGLSLYKPAHAQPTQEDQKTTVAFLRPSASQKERYTMLTEYFVRGFLQYGTTTGARVQYPGLPSKKGFYVNGVEGFARTAPLVAAWGNSLPVTAPQKKVLQRYLKTAILAGTNPNSPDYWGDMVDYDQRIVEAGDIAKLLWLTRDYVWKTLSSAEKDQVKAWLSQALTHKVWPNNWLLFPVVVQVTLDRLENKSTSIEHPQYQKFKSFYTESGWFFDYPHGFDYYNAWGISYDLFWLTWINPDFDRDFIRQVLQGSSSLVSHLISPKGVPMMGRSVCYRTGIPAPVLAQSLLTSTQTAQGLAMRSLDAIWTYFVSHNVLRDNTITQGYLQTEPRLLDLYSGPGSCHWGLRSLTLAWMQPSSFWEAPATPLPVEEASFEKTYPKIGWRIEGNAQTQQITLHILKNTKEGLQLQGPSWKTWLKGTLLFQPVRPKNDPFRYEQKTYVVTPPLAE